MKVLIIGKHNFDLIDPLISSLSWLPQVKTEMRGGHQSGLKSLREHTFDFVFCELNPARQPLFDSLAQLREAAPEAVLVVITPAGSQSWEREVLRTGADDVLERPEINMGTLSRIFRYGLERRKMLREYFRASNEARQSNQAKSAFMANMSHEIRTPLNLIIGTADLLGGTTLNALQRRLVSSFSKAGNHLLSLLNDVLDLSQLESQGLNCVDASFDLSQIVLEACEIVGVLCRAKKLTFDYLLDDKLPEALLGDKLRLRQVLLNLLSNAVKFTSHGGIQLRVELAERTNTECKIKISVRDTGIGIAPAELSRVFDCFYQTDSGLERQYRGTGLGLSIVKAIVDHYHGRVEVESHPGHGTEVKVTLSIALDLGEKPLAIPFLKDRKILIATVGTLEAQSISHQLQRLGATTVWLSSGLAALDRLQSEPFDYALLDLQTGDQGALQLLERDDFIFPRDRVVILMPPVHRRTDPADCQRLGVTKSIYKPFSPAQFLNLIASSEFEQRKPKSDAKGFELLIVDDDFETRELMAAFLAKTPHQVTYAKTGYEALKIVEWRTFDVILMDIEMPGLNGYETTRRLKELPHAKNTKIVGLSANAFPENVAEAKRVGFSGYLTKPIRKDRLLASLTECLEAHGFYEAVSTALADSV